MATQAPPSGGLALNTDFVSDQPLRLIMKRESLGADFEINLEDGSPLFRIDADAMSTSHQKHVIDPRSGHELFTIRKEVWSMHYKYSAELPDGSGNMLFESETESGLFSGPTTTMSFRNALRGGETDIVELKVHAMGSEHEITWQGENVAEIHKESFKMRTEYHLSMAAGIDPLLVVVLATVMDDRARTQRRRAA